MKNLFPFIFTLLFTCQAFSQVLPGEEEEQEDLIEYEGDILDTTAVFSRAIEYSAEFNLRGMGAVGDRLPFWMYHNQRGRVAEDANFSGWLTGKGVYFFSENSFLEAGAGILYQDGTTNEGAVPDELYVHYENPWLQVTAGRKQRPALYHGISASNENILWSLNARPLPGLRLQTNGPIFIINETGVGFEASWSEYFLGKDRQIEDAKLHHKSFHLLYRTTTGFQVKLGMQHFAHWGGTSTSDRDLPEASGDYIEAVTLRNNLHTHMSSWEAYISQEFTNFRLELLYNHIAVDQSGRRFGNTPDGRYGIFYEHSDPDRWVNAVIYELYYTKHQDYDASGFPIDDYFNRYQYGQGWAYKDRFLGAPFFTYDAEEQQVVNNKFIAHHVGLRGQYSTLFNTYPYELMLSYSRNEGTYFDNYNPQQNILATYFDVRVLQTFVDVNIQFATEFNNTASPIYGGAIHLKYEL